MLLIIFCLLHNTIFFVKRKAIVAGDYEPAENECDIPLIHGLFVFCVGCGTYSLAPSPTLASSFSSMRWN